jgi:ArsR family transcriptional regulator
MAEQDLTTMERLYMSLADKTRLRLLNLMRGNEVCVCFFTEVLGESQPKVSRHLAYLRGAGLVEARRDGKWMHYRIVRPAEPAAARVLDSALDWLGSLDDMKIDLENYEKVCCTPELLVQIARTPIDFIEPTREKIPEPDVRQPVATPASATVSHNELEEFLL